MCKRNILIWRLQNKIKQTPRSTHPFHLFPSASLAHLFVESIGVQPDGAQSCVEETVGACDVSSTHAFDALHVSLQRERRCLHRRVNNTSPVVYWIGWWGRELRGALRCALRAPPEAFYGSPIAAVLYSSLVRILNLQCNNHHSDIFM